MTDAEMLRCLIIIRPVHLDGGYLFIKSLHNYGIFRRLGIRGAPKAGPRFPKGGAPKVPPVLANQIRCKVLLSTLVNLCESLSIQMQGARCNQCLAVHQQLCFFGACR